MKIFVTGGTGFIGSRLVKYLINYGYYVRLLIRRNSFVERIEKLDVEYIEGDITDFDSLKRALNGCSVVFHLASIYAFYPFWDRRNIKLLYKINVDGTRNILQVALEESMEKFIYTSSIAVLHRKTGHYANSKYLAEQEVLRFSKLGLPAVVLRPGVVIGEGDRKPTPSGDIVLNFLKGRYPFYRNTIWPIADVDDVAIAHVNAIQRAKCGEIYNLCNSRTYTTKEIFQILEQISAIKATKMKLPYSLMLVFSYIEQLWCSILRKRPLLPTEGVRFCETVKSLNNSNAVRDLGFNCTSVEQTFRKAVDWFRENGYIENA